MMRHKWLRIIALAVIVAVPALAGDYGKKCTASTQECLDHMATKMKTAGWIGIEYDHDAESGAITVVKVIPGSPAETAGLQAGDVLSALNGIRLSKDNEEAVAKARKGMKPGQTVNYTIKRAGAEREVAITLAPWPADALARAIGEHMLEHATIEVAAK